jgi:2-succinyl-6-hydroxy-2,4-cyclohexadiene-1-carboxylate synthase
LVALHGFLGHPAAFSSLALEQLVEHVYCPLLMGHGPEPPAPAATFEAELERLRREIEALPRPRRLLGYSQGGRLGLGLLSAQPTLFDQAVLIGVQPGCRSAQERKARRLLEDSWIARLEDEGVAAFAAWWSDLPLFGPPLGPDAQRAQHPYRWHHTTAGLVSALLVLGTSQMPNLWPELPAIECEVELWVGDLDTKFCEIAEEMCSTLPRARLHRFEAAHHNPIRDCPGRVAARLQAGLVA